MTYSSSIALGRQRHYGAKNKNINSFRSTGKSLGPISNTIVLVILACLLGLLYLTQVTKVTSLSYRLDDLKAKQSSLVTEQKQLEIDSARLQSLSRVKSSTVNQNLVSVAPAQTLQ